MAGRATGVALAATITAGLVCVGVAAHEWRYHQHHRYASGPSLELVALGIAGALVAFSVTWLINKLDVESTDARIRAKYELDR